VCGVMAGAGGGADKVAYCLLVSSTLHTKQQSARRFLRFIADAGLEPAISEDDRANLAE
jgi:hypothetical protein